MSNKTLNITSVIAVVIIAVTRRITVCADFYALHIYPWLSAALSFFAQAVPFSLEEIIVLAILAAIIVRLVKKRIASALRLLALTYIWFYLGWGLNYSRSGLLERAGKESTQYDSVQFVTFLYDYSTQLDQLYKSSYPTLSSETSLTQNSELSSSVREAGLSSVREAGLAECALTYDLEEGMKEFFRGVPKKYGLAVPREWQHNKKPLLNWLYSGCGVLGFMGPFMAESQLNTDLQPHEYPFTLMHEYAHLLGVASESEANWWAFQACNEQSCASVRFSAYYSLLPYVYSNARAALGKEDFDAWRNTLNNQVLTLHNQSRDYWQEKYFEPLAKAQDFLQNVLLRSNGIQSGTQSYSHVIGLLMALPAVE